MTREEQLYQLISFAKSQGWEEGASWIAKKLQEERDLKNLHGTKRGKKTIEVTLARTGTRVRLKIDQIKKYLK